MPETMASSTDFARSSSAVRRSTDTALEQLSRRPARPRSRRRDDADRATRCGESNTRQRLVPAGLRCDDRDRELSRDGDVRSCCKPRGSPNCALRPSCQRLEPRASPRAAAMTARMLYRLERRRARRRDTSYEAAGSRCGLRRARSGTDLDHAHAPDGLPQRTHRGRYEAARELAPRPRDLRRVRCRTTTSSDLPLQALARDLDRARSRSSSTRRAPIGARPPPGRPALPSPRRRRDRLAAAGIRAVADADAGAPSRASPATRTVRSSAA